MATLQRVLPVRLSLTAATTLEPGSLMLATPQRDASHLYCRARLLALRFLLHSSSTTTLASAGSFHDPQGPFPLRLHQDHRTPRCRPNSPL